MRVLNPALLPVATTVAPTIVCPVPAASVTAPEPVPVLITVQSKQPFSGNAGADTPASLSVPVGRVSVIAAVPEVVTISVSNSAIVSVALAALAVGVGC